MRIKLFERLKKNVVTFILALLFIIVYIIKNLKPEVNDILGTCSLNFINGEYYRWFTCPFLHYGLYHLCGNIVGLLAVGSLLSPFIGKWKTLFLFFISAALGEAAVSWLVTGSEPNYGGGASGGIFALIAALIVCYLRFPEQFKCKWHRIDVIAVIIYFFAANDDWLSFLTHTFGFTFGTVLAFLFVVFKLIREPKNELNDNNTLK